MSSTITQTFILANNGITSKPLTGSELVLSVAQNISNILTTIQGQDRLRPDFGSRVIDCLDKPLQKAKLCVISAIADAISKWEKRVSLLKTEVASTDNSGLIVTISWKLL
jgi:phage baseplate assembly protein W